ncbi:MAG: hypothetical protein ABEJ07_06280 [Candidatus Nanohaloarchaea archaeon]
MNLEQRVEELEGEVNGRELEIGHDLMEGFNDPDRAHLRALLLAGKQDKFREELEEILATQSCSLEHCDWNDLCTLWDIIAEDNLEFLRERVQPEAESKP